ncbi:TonB-dependent receptor [Ancylothrix sp. C2]|nr:TonB-dependent receptor [Ancylothrix sp. D3o]
MSFLGTLSLVSRPAKATTHTTSSENLQEHTQYNFVLEQNLTNFQDSGNLTGYIGQTTSKNRAISGGTNSLEALPHKDSTPSNSVNLKTGNNDSLVDALLSNPDQIGTIAGTFSRINDITGIKSGTSENTLNRPVAEGNRVLIAQENSPQTQQNSAPFVKIISPTPAAVLDIPATTVILQYSAGLEIELRVNGVPVDTSLIGRTETDENSNITTQTWYGVPLKEGENTLEIAIKNPPPNSNFQPPITISVRGNVAQLKIRTQETRIPADGRSTATIIGEILDEKGNRSNRDAIITLAASAGRFISTDYDTDQPGFQVKAINGEFTATLQSGIAAQLVRIRAVTLKSDTPLEIENNGIANEGQKPELEAFTQIQFETNLRPSLMTGVVDFRFGRGGTDYWGRFRDFLPYGSDNSYQFDARGAAFATGTFGEWLFTGAFNSYRTLNETCGSQDRLFRDTQFYEQNYPTYGDNCTRETVTPSRDSLYLRFERSPNIMGANPDYFMWGDYGLAEFSTQSQQFTAITRQLHGFKGNYNLGDLQLSGFFSGDVEGFQRDTIVPDGTSGFYFLSRRLVLPGSENIFLEVEELERPGTVLYRKQLTRGTDYEIDYDRGTVLFRRPILRVEVDPLGSVLVRRIVGTYQYENRDGSTSVMGGRLQYNISRDLGRPSWIGATYLREDRGARDFELYGADGILSFGRNQLIAEYAHSSNDSEFQGRVSGSAYRLELTGRLGQGAALFGNTEIFTTPGVENNSNSSPINYRLYYRSTDAGFSNNATTSFVAGQTRYGGQVSANITSTTQLRFNADHEKNQGIAPRSLNSYADLFEPRLEFVPGTQQDNSLTTLSAGLLQRLGNDATFELDWVSRNREDVRENSPLNSTSSQLRSRLTYRFAENLVFRAQNELGLTSQQDYIYPDRTILALDWTAYPGITVRLSHIFFTGGQFENNSITSLDFLGDYKLGEDTTITGRFGFVDAQAMTGAVGIRQGWTIAPGLRIDGSYEHIFGDLFGRRGTGVQYAQPYAYGGGASALGVSGGDSYSLGIQYTNNPDFQASARYEHRNSSAGSNTVIAATANGKISRSIMALFRYQQASSSNQLLEALGDSKNLRLGLAYRDPENDQFNALLRYEYRQNPSIIPDTLFFGTGTGGTDHTFALEAIYAPNWQWEFYGKTALRQSTSYLASDLIGSGTTYLNQLRTTYRFAYQWDLVGEVRWITQPADNYSETGLVVETGYYLTPNLRLAAGYVFGEISDRDFDASRSASGPYIGLTVKLNELFSGFGLQKPTPPPPRQPETTEAKKSPDLALGK